MAAQCPFWTDGHVSDCAGEILRPTACLISAVILFTRLLYPGNTSLSRQYITTLSPLVSRLELCGLLADLSLSVLPVIIGGYQSDNNASSLLLASISPIYLSLLVLLRRIASIKFGLTLRSHSLILYTTQWFLWATTLHTQVVTDASENIFLLTIGRFAIFGTLCLLHWNSRRTPVQDSLQGDANGNGDVLGSEPSKEGTASLLSRLSFSWLSGLIWKAYRTTLEVSDLYPLNPDQQSDAVFRRFTTGYSSSPMLLRLWRFIRYDMFLQGLWAAINSVAVYISPALIRFFLKYLESDEEETKTGWLFVGGFLIAGVLVGTSDCQCEWKGRRTSAKVRSALVNDIYTKVLRKGVPSHAGDGPNQTATDGAIFNLMSVDAESVSGMSATLHFVWVTFPVQTSIGTWLLYKLLGISGILGVIAMVALLPLNFLIARRVMAVQARVLTASDARIHVTNDVLTNLRTIKYSSWIKPFMGRVLAKRQIEIAEIRSRCIWWSINMTTFHALPVIVTMITLFLYTIVFGKSLDTSTAFPALAVFGIIRIPLDRMASSISFIMKAYVSLTRIERFLQERETWKYEQLQHFFSESVGFENATLAWPAATVSERGSPPNDERFTEENIPLAEIVNQGQHFLLENLHISFRTNALNVILGPSGSGKSSLLLSLLGEMDLIEGRVHLPHDKNAEHTSLGSLNNTTAYCPQEPWIMNRSIRSNIIMDFSFDARKYEKVIQATALHSDIKGLDQGDLSMAGEGGSRLSGGQKQRVALARVLYSPCKYVLLDDCLSAVDSRTANHIFFQAIKGPLMAGRTCVLATHSTQLVVPHSDYIVLLHEGRVIEHGTSDELRTKGGKLDSLPYTKGDQSRETVGATPSESDSLYDDTEIDGKSTNVESQSSHTETKAEGKVSWSVIRTYLATIGPRRYWVMVLFMFGVQQIAALATNLWIKQWSLQDDNRQTGPPNSWYYMAAYVAICLSYVLITFIRDLITLYGTLRASSSIYPKLLESVLRAKSLWLDRTPIGQITNRLTKDIEVMDQSLPGFSISGLQLTTSMILTVGSISFILPGFLLAAVFICVAYYFVTIVYINAARDLNRIESVQRSPLYQQLSESLAGCVSLRAYAKTEFASMQNNVLVDNINQAYLLQWATQAWLTFRIEILSSLVSFFTAGFVLIKGRSINAGSAGLVLTFASTFTENVMWFVQVYSIVQRNLNSVERIIEYVGIDQEEASAKAVYDLPEDWPTDGRVRFQEYSTRYAPELDVVLGGITFEVRPGERVAVVGRTGAGKSTLALALIRVLEAEGGSIEIDGVDIRSVPLDRLRQAITLVPQDPQLFDGTIRDNLDPLQAYSDYEMLALLRRLRLFGHYDELAGLEYADDKKTGNIGFFTDLDQPAKTLSRGQRQLLCIVRGLLRKTRILVLDEATASIDYTADAAIQETIRMSIAEGTTILTIAHRLRTIADYDKVVVLDAGRVVEQGSVGELLARRGTDAVFRRLCEESGDLGMIEKVAGGGNSR